MGARPSRCDRHAEHKLLTHEQALAVASALCDKYGGGRALVTINTEPNVSIRGKIHYDGADPRAQFEAAYTIRTALPCADVKAGRRAASFSCWTVPIIPPADDDVKVGAV